MISNAMNDSFSSYSEGTPIVNKIDNNFELFSQINLNNVLTSPKNYRRQSKKETDNNNNENNNNSNNPPQLQSQKTIRLERKQTLAIASEETVILPNTKRPIRIYTIYDKDKMQINNNEGESQMQKEIQNLKQQKFEKRVNNMNNNDHHQQVPHPSLPTKIKRCLSGDIVKYKSLLQVLDEEHRLQQQQDSIPTIMIASGIAQPSDGRRKSQINFTNRKGKKDNNTLAQKFLIMRQQRKKKKQTKRLRRKSCTCHECGGQQSTYELKYNDMDIDTAMSRKMKLASLVIDNLKCFSKETSVKKEKQMNALKAALEKTFLEQVDQIGQSQNSIQEIKDQQTFQQEQAKYERRQVRIQTNVKQTQIYYGEASPDKLQTPASKMTDQDYKERLTQTDLDNYKFNRNKSKYSRANENIKKMRNTMISYNIIESLSNIHDESTNQRSLRSINKNGTLSLRNLGTLDTRQSPEKRSCPYKLQERYTGNNQFRQLPAKIIPRKDIQNLFFKQANAFDKVLGDIEQIQSSSTFKSPNPISNRIIKNSGIGSSIDLRGTTEQFFSSVMQQRQQRSQNQSDSQLLKISIINGVNSGGQSSTLSSSKLSLTTPLKQFNHIDKNNYYYNNHINNNHHHNNNYSSHNGQYNEQSNNLFFNYNSVKEFNSTTKQHFHTNNNNSNPFFNNPYTNSNTASKGRITPLRSRTPHHQLPNIEVISTSYRK